MKHSPRRPPRGPNLPALLATVAALTVVIAAPGQVSFGVSALGRAVTRAHPAATPVPAPRGKAPSTLELRVQRLNAEIRFRVKALDARHSATPRLARRLVALSRTRQRTLLALLAKDPAVVHRLILPRRVRAELARVKGARVESTVAVNGRYAIWHRDDFRHPAHDVYADRLISAAGKISDLYGINSQAAVRLTFARLKTNVPIAVHGYELSGRLLATRVSNTGRSLASAAGATTTGSVATAVIGVNFSDSATPIDMSAIRANFQGSPGNDVVSYFSQASYGRMTLVPSFFGPYTLGSTTSAGCTGDQTQAVMNAANADVNFTQVRRLILVFNCPGTFGSAASEGPLVTPDGTITAAEITADPGSAADLWAMVHELSHTLGSFNSHAAYYDCLPDAFTPPTRFDTGCLSSEYGDPFDVLGGGPWHMVSQLDPYHKANAGWFTPGQFPTVTTPGTTTYTLAPYESPSSGMAALNIPRGNTGTAFTVEYRQPIGFDSWMASASSSVCPHSCTPIQGASIRLVAGGGGGGGGSDTQFIDTTPGSIGSLYPAPFEDESDGALLPGKTFTDPEYGISITTVSADATGLTVRVTIPAQTCVHAPPTLSTMSPVSQTATPGQTATYTATLTNNDSAGCPANTFRYLSPSVNSVQIVVRPDLMKLAPGASTQVSLAVSATPMAVDGTQTFTSIDGVGGGYFQSNTLGTASAIAAGFSFTLTSAADATAPTAPTGIAAQALGARALKLSWQPSSDNVGVVGYQVQSSTGYGYSTTDTTLVVPDASPSTSYSYTIQAFDRRGNYSQPVTVSATTPAKSDYAGPTAPVLSADAADHSIRLSWTASTDNNGVAYYRLYPCLVPNCVVPASVRSLTLTGLTTRSEYDFVVTAVDGDGNSSPRGSSTYSVYTSSEGDPVAPSQPKQLVSTSGSYGSLEFSWAPSTDNKPIAGYYVYRNGRMVATVSGTSFTDTKALGMTEYHVQAIDADGSLSPMSTSVYFPAPLAASTDATPPTGSISAPVDGATLSGTVPIASSVADDVAVTRVQFFVDGMAVAASTTAPFTFSWDTTTVADGPHWLYVRASDAAGNYGTTGVVNVTVKNSTVDTAPPTVAITAPSSGAALTGPTTVSATATDDVGVTKAELSVDGTPTQTDTAMPWSFTVDPSTLAAGTHTLKVTANDAAGNSSSAQVGVTVPTPPDTTPPAVSITSPAANATVSGTVQVQASASDNVSVAKVDLYVDGSLNNTDTAGPWTFGLDTTPLAAGSHTLTAKAYDSAGNNASTQVSVNVPSAGGDTTSPRAPSSLKAAVVGNTQVAVYWAPSTDNVGVVAYEVTRDGTVIGTSALPNYLDSGLTPGTTHVYSVRAVDAAGNRSSASSNLNARIPAVSTSTTGTISGVVYNPLGRPLGNAVIQLTGNGLTKSSKTNTSGVYKFSSLPPGSYALTVTPPTGSGATALAATVISISASTVAGQTTVIVTSVSPT